MKNLKTFLCAMLALVSIGVIAQPTPPSAGGVPNFATNLIVPTPMTLSVASNFVLQPLTINPGYGVGLAASYCMSNSADTGTLTLYLVGSVDGTNFSANALCSYALLSAAATINQLNVTNFPSTLFDGLRAVAVGYETNSSAHGLTNIQVTLSRRRLDWR